tara:strand:- start:477 stop:815 length:339 start_codon:yes stop_codon:yes gene_type:complete
MNLDDAKLILSDLLEYEVVDSLLTVYKEKDSLNTETIILHKDVIVKLTQKNENYEEQLSNFNTLLKNKSEELRLNEDIIKQQKKEIRKQKFLKFLGVGGSILLPIITFLLMS